MNNTEYHGEGQLQPRKHWAVDNGRKSIKNERKVKLFSQYQRYKIERRLKYDIKTKGRRLFLMQYYAEMSGFNGQSR